MGDDEILDEPRNTQWRYNGFDTPEDSGVFLFLRKHAGKWVSQKTIANRLTMSRSAAGRHVLTLSEGGAIEKKRITREGRSYYVYRVAVAN